MSKFRISRTDSEPGFGEDKLTAGDGLTITKVSDGGSESLRIDVVDQIDEGSIGAFQDGYTVKVTGDDTTPNFLYNKLVAGQNVVLTVNACGGDETITIDAVDPDFSGLDQTITEHHNQQDQINQSILQELDGYAQNITVTEHYNQLSDAIEYLRQAADAYGNAFTETEHYNQQQQINQSIIQALDGYAPEITFQQFKNAQYQINQSILQAIDGYSPIAVEGIVNTELEHHHQHSIAIDLLRQAADAYSINIDEHYSQQQQVNQSILQALDGYAQNTTITEHYNQQGQINQTILQALDGYNLNITEHYNQQGQINQSIIQAFDGYNQTITEHYNQQGQINQTILTTLDGYGTIFDGYVYEDLMPLYDDVLRLGGGNRWYSITAGSEGFHLVSRGAVSDAYAEINTVVGLLGVESDLAGTIGYYNIAKPANKSFIWPASNIVVSKTNEIYFSQPKASSGSEASQSGTYQQILKVNKDGLLQRITSGVSYTANTLSVYELRDLIYTTSPHISQIAGIKILGCDNNNIAYFVSNAADDDVFANQLFPTFIGKINSDGTTTLVAGTGEVSPLSGDGGQAIDANIWVDYSPGLRFDTDNNLYFSENLEAPDAGGDGRRIRKIDASTGVITTVYTEVGAADDIIFDIANDGTIYASYGEILSSQRRAIYTLPGLTRIASAASYGFADIAAIRIDPGQQTLYFTGRDSLYTIGTVNLQTKEVGELINHASFSNHGNSTGDGKPVDSNTRISLLYGYMDVDKFGNIYFPDFDFAIRKISFQYDERVNTYDFSWRIDENDGYIAKLTSTINGYQQDLIYASPGIDGYIGIGCVGNERLTVKGAISLENIGVIPIVQDGYGKIFSWSADRHLYFINSDGQIARLDEGLIGTVQEHHNQFSQAIETIRKDLDGYNQTITEHYQQQSQVNQAILQNLDGYAQNWSDSLQQLQDLRNSADAYGSTLYDFKEAQWQINQSILQALDGYELITTVSGLETTFQENKNAQSEINRQILLSIDGYAQNITVTENKNAQQQINQSILQALDGYALAAAVNGVVEQTFQENKNAQQQINQSILQALDGYALAAIVSVTETTFQENKNAQQQINQTIIQALDGYSTYINSDGYAIGQISPNADAVYKLGDPSYRWKDIYTGEGGLHLKSEIFQGGGGGGADAYIDNVGYINTIMGDGTNTTSSDPSTGTAATVSAPMGMDYVPAARAILLADNVTLRLLHLDTNLVTRIAGSGTYGTTATSGTATSANLSTIRACCYDFINDRYFFTQSDESRIKMVSNGVLSVIAGTGSAGNTGDGGAATSATLQNDLFGIDMDASGNIYIADGGNNRIRKFTVGGNISNFAGDSGGGSGNTGDGGAATSATLNVPRGIRLDPNDEYLYIADVVNNRVRRVNLSSGVISNYAGSSAGTAGNTGEGGLATSATLNFPLDVCFDGYGNTYIRDGNNNVIKKVKSNGTIGTVAGDGHGRFTGDGGSALAASIWIGGSGNAPGIIFPEEGNTLYIADERNDRVRKVSFDFTAAEVGVPDGDIYRDYHLAVGADNHNFLIRDGYGNSVNSPKTLLSIDPENEYVGLSTDTPTAALDMQNLATATLRIVDAGTAGATNAGWIEITIGGVTMYLRAQTTK